MSFTIKNLTLRGTSDYSKIVGEVLRSLKVTTCAADAKADIDALEIFNEVIGKRITTRLKVTLDGENVFYKKSAQVRPDERHGAEVNRLVKKNLYTLLVDAFKLDAVPYGILHGVRPTKIVQRWIDTGYGVTSQGVIDRDKISRRICSDFLTERDKSNLLTEVAVRQLPIIRATDDKTIGVYVGIPFCKTRCLYCSFPSNVLPAEDKIAEFMEILTRDIAAAAEAVKRHGLKVQTIYIGGGTPTALPEKFFVEMLAKVHDNFSGSSVAEFTVECGRPDTITAEKIAALKQFGVTRVSVNPQTMHQRTLDLIGRKHTVEQIIQAFDALRAASDWQINMDLICGLPGESLADFAESLDKVIALAPDDVTIHALAIKRGSALQMRLADEINRLEDFNLPNDAEVRRMSEHAAKVLRCHKYLPYYLYRQDYMSGQIENVGWCRRDAAGLYNVQIMGERQTIIGTGAAASTKVPADKKILTAFMPKDLTTYLRDIDTYIAQRDKILAQVYSPIAEEIAPVETIQPIAEEIAPVEVIKPIAEEIAPVETIQPVAEEIAPAETIQPIAEEIAPAETIQPVAEEIAPAEVIQPIAEEIAPVETVKPITEEIAPVETIRPIVEEIAPVETIQPIAEEIAPVETIQPIAEEIAPVEVIHPIVEEIAPVETIQPIAEEIAPLETVKPIAEEISPVETIKPIAEEIASVETIQPFAEEIAPAETIQPVAEEIAPAETIQPIAEEIAPVETIQPIAEEIAPVEQIQPIAEEIALVKTIQPIVEEIAPVEVIQPIAEEIAPAEVIQPVAEEIAPAEVIQPVAEEIAPVEQIQPIAEEIAPAETIQPIAAEIAPAETIQPIAAEIAPVEKKNVDAAE